MSKYKVGDKFIINIKEVLESERGTLYRADFSTLAFDDYGLDKLQKIKPELKIEDIDDMIAEYDLRKTSYDKGLNDAWELAKKIFAPPGCGGLLVNEVIEIFGCDYYEVAKNFTPQEALAKLKAYEDSKIEVGDVVELPTGTKCVVTAVRDNIADGFTEVGYSFYDLPTKDLKKTGKHIDIKSILEQIGE